MTPYDLYIGVDWSGARGPALPGLQVASCTAGAGAPRLVANPAGGAWTRVGFGDWLVRVMRRRGVLCGIDFAFGLPYRDTGNYFPGIGRQPRSMLALWWFVDRFCASDPEFYAGRFVAEPPFADFFLGPGRHRGRRFSARMRDIDRRCREANLGRPESVFKAVGAAQVAKGSLAGMRFLHWLRSAAPAVGIWPKDGWRAGGSQVIEIYPGAFLGRVGHVGRKVRDRATLNEMLARYDSRPYRAPLPEGARGLDDQTDALVSAAAIRRLAGERDCWRPRWSATARRYEGWIFGVG